MTENFRSCKLNLLGWVRNSAHWKKKQKNKNKTKNKCCKEKCQMLSHIQDWDNAIDSTNSVVSIQLTRVVLFNGQIAHPIYFLIERSSKLRRGSSRFPFMIEVRVKDDDFGSTPGWILCVVDTRPPLEASRLERTSLGSVEEVGLLAEMARFEELPFREVRPLSESNSCKMHA